MPIQLTCPQCDAKMRAPEAVIGKQVKCPKCGTMFLASEAPPPPPPPAAVTAPVTPPTPPPSSPVPDPYSQPSAADDEPAFRSRGGGYHSDDIPGYRTLISPLIGVHVIFWGTLGICLYYGFRLLVDAINTMDRSMALAFHEFMMAIVILVIIPFTVRLQCEIFVVLYQILQTLRQTRDRQK